MRGPRFAGGAATAALLLFLVSFSPSRVTAAGGGDEIGAASGGGPSRGGGPSDYSVRVAAAQAELVVARGELALSRDALTTAEQAVALADTPLLRDTITRIRAEIATLLGEVASAKALLHSVITSGPAQPAGADGASGSGLRAGGRAPKRALRSESDEDNGIDEDDPASAGIGRRPARLAELPRTVPTPQLGFIDSEGKVHRKHAGLAHSLGLNLTLGWTAADAATTLLEECTRCANEEATIHPDVVRTIASQFLLPVVELIRNFADRGQALHIEHRYGTVVAREYVGDDLPATPAEQRRLKRAQAAAKEVTAVAARAANTNRNTPRVRQPRSRGGGGFGGGRGVASGPNAAALGGGGRGRGRGGGGRGGGPTCYNCGQLGHMRDACPNP
jgi:hypothetical protein